MNSFPPVCGIVAEYNPFHSGHMFHIRRTREKLGGDTIIVCAMSGNFVQRGDFTVLDKYVRAEMAVRGGADLVLELPLAAALSSAEGFARGAVALLHGIGCRFLSFGAENADISLVQQAAEALNALSPASGNRSGLSYAACRQQELAALDPAAAALLESPNNTLGIEYCRALRDFPMQPLAVARRGRTLLRRQDGFPLIVKPVTEKQLPDALQPSLRLDAFADDLFGLAQPAPLPGGEHYRKTPFYLT